MKKVITFITIALLALTVKTAQAQGSFNFDNASDFRLIVLDEGSENYWEITPRITQDLRINGAYGENGAPNTGERLMDIWQPNSYVVNPSADKGSLGQIGGYLDFSATALGWGGGGFALIPFVGSTVKVDFTTLTDDHRFHMAVRKTNTDPCRINLGGGGTAEGKVDPAQTGQFIVGVGDHVYNDAAMPNLTPDFKVNTWQVIDIPVSELKTMGWNNRAPFVGAGFYYFSYEFGNTAANNLQVDAVFYYKGSGSGIFTPNADNKKLDVLVTDKIVEVFNATEPIEVYDLAGIKVKTSEAPIFGVEELNKGVYIVKSGNAAAKVAIR